MDKTFKRFGRRYKQLIEGREDAFYAICLDSVVEKAEQGDVAAFEWLEKRGLVICLDSVVEKAEQGDVAAIEWLEKRGFVKFPAMLSQ